jgi:hypothetical protein
MSTEVPSVGIFWEIKRLCLTKKDLPTTAKQLLKFSSFNSSSIKNLFCMAFSEDVMLSQESHNLLRNFGFQVTLYHGVKYYLSVTILLLDNKFTIK